MSSSPQYTKEDKLTRSGFHTTLQLEENSMQFQRGKFIIALVIINLGTALGCAKLLEEPPQLERVNATFFYDPMSASVLGAYSVELPEERDIRRVIVHSLDRNRNADIYVRAGKHGWIHTEQIKSMSEGATIINLRARGDAVRVIPKTVVIRVIQDVEVFAIPKQN